MTDHHQQDTPTTLTDAAARCRAVVERHSPVTTDNLRPGREIVIDAPLILLYNPYGMIVAGILFMTTGGVVGIATGGLTDGIQSAALIGVLTVGAVVVLGDDLRPRPDPPDSARFRDSPSDGENADESAENRAHSTTTTTTEANHDSHTNPD